MIVDPLATLHEKTVEPVQRMVGGQFGWAVHRFPIKGGISRIEATARSLAELAARPSYFSKYLKELGQETKTAPEGAASSSCSAPSAAGGPAAPAPAPRAARAAGRR